MAATRSSAVEPSPVRSTRKATPSLRPDLPRRGGATSGDLHVAGFDVSVSAETTQDLYAAGATVVVRGSVGEDLTAVGFSVRTESTSETRGNARLVGNTLTIEGPVSGALTATGTDVILNATGCGGRAHRCGRNLLRI